MYVSSEVSDMIKQAFSLANNAQFEYITPELFLYVTCQNKKFAQAFRNCDGSVRRLDFQLKTWLEENMEQLSEDDDQKPELSQGMLLALSYAWETAQNSEKPLVELPHILHAIYALTESYAAYYMLLQSVEEADLLREMTIAYEDPSYKKTTEKSRQTISDTGIRLIGNSFPMEQSGNKQPPVSRPFGGCPAGII